MKFAAISKEGGLTLLDGSVPHPRDGDILVEMKVCGICGTDLEKVQGHSITTPILGHEVAGVVREVGAKIKLFKEGDRVTVHHHLSCGICFYCKNGFETLCESYPRINLDPCGFAEYFRVPERLVEGGAVYSLPDSVSFEDGCQVEPTACCIRALERSSFKVGETVSVFGVGPAGLTLTWLLKLFGSTLIVAVDMVQRRREMAGKLGANVTVNPEAEDVREAIHKETGNEGVDLAVVATGNTKAVEQAFNSVRKGGRVLLFGAPAKGALVTLDLSRLFLREVGFQSSYSTSEREMRSALDLIESKRITPSLLVTHRFPLKAITRAFQLAAARTEALKVLVEASRD